MNQALTSRLYEYQYQFDAGGNRTQMKYFDGSTTTTTSYTHNDGNQLTMREVGAQDYSYTYDNNGNMTAELDNKDDPIREFTWNRDDRLIAANRDEFGTSSYVYDALGRRIVRTSGTTSTFYYYDGLMVIAEKQKVGEGNWDWQRIFTTGPGVIGNIFRISEKSGESWSDAYYHYDAIGNVVLRTNGYGSVLESLDQEAYGNVKTGSQTGYHLTTKEYDSIPELFYFCARWYDNTLGRFISHDPKPNVNLYRYCRNNPITIIDPTGMIIQICISDAFGIPGINHVFFHDTETGNKCGTSSDLIWPGNPTLDHVGYPTSECYNVPGTENKCKQDCIMNCCQTYANRGLYFPFINDCHTAVNQCLACCGIRRPDGIPGRINQLSDLDHIARYDREIPMCRQ